MKHFPEGQLISSKKKKLLMLIFLKLSELKRLQLEKV